MDLWATKDPYELETEETERLVRPAPKVKPPRHDRRRDTVDDVCDPDIDTDPDIARDKDLSLNFKNIGGSMHPMALRVARRFRADIDRSSVEHASETKHPEHPDDDESKSELINVVRKEDGKHVQVSEETLKGPDGSKYELPEEHKGDEATKGDEGKAPEEANKGEDKGDQGKKPVKDNAFYGRAHQQLREMGEKDPKFESLLKVFKDPTNALHNIGKEAPDTPLTKFLRGHTFPEGIETFGDLQKALESAPPAPAKGKGKGKPGPESPPAQAAPGKEPDKGPGKTLPLPGKQPEEPKEPAEEPFEEKPGDYNYGGPSSEQKQDLAQWVKDKGHTRKDFKEWVDKQKTVTQDKEGRPLFPSGGKGKKRKLPFEELPFKEQLQYKEQFENESRLEENVKELKNLAKNPETRTLLRELANPESKLRRRIEQEARDEDRDLDESDIQKSIPEFANVELPKGITNVQELLKATDKYFAPPPEPERSKPTKEEKIRAEEAVNETFPKEIAEQIEAMDLHPHDAGFLVAAYHQAMSKPVSSKNVHKLVEALSSGGYNVDPEKMEPPSKVKIHGEVKSFEELTPEDQAEAFAQSKMQILAASFAARRRVSEELESKGLPERVAGQIAHTMLTAGDKEIPDDAVDQFYKESLATAPPARELKTPKQVKDLLDAVGDDQNARKMVVAYLQAHDYAAARSKFLTPKDSLRPTASDNDRISEWDDPSLTAKKIERASVYLQERQKAYPRDARVRDTAMDFRNRVIDRLKYLSPEKVPFIRAFIHKHEVEEYEANDKVYQKDQKAYREALEKEKKHDREPAGHPYREPAGDSVEERLRKKGIHAPRRPVPPPGYDASKEPNEEKGKGIWKLWDKIFSEENKSPAKTASVKRVLARFLVPDLAERVALRYAFATFSSYSALKTMGQPSSDSTRTAVYWGQEPYEDTAAYPAWTQLQARDFDKKDFEGLLASAREWLTLPVLGRSIQGWVPDVQVRAALDLALRDHEGGKYAAGVYPTVYNELLARLTGVKSATPMLQGRTTAIGSTYGAPSEEVRTMKASVQARLFASRAAAATRDAELPFDLIGFADHLAAEEAQEPQEKQEEKGEKEKQAAIRIATDALTKSHTLRSLIIRQAARHPEAREAFLPLLQNIKS